MYTEYFRLINDSSVATYLKVIISFSSTLIGYGIFVDFFGNKLSDFFQEFLKNRIRRIYCSNVSTFMVNIKSNNSINIGILGSIKFLSNTFSIVFQSVKLCQNK